MRGPVRDDSRVNICLTLLFVIFFSGCYREAKVPLPAIYHETTAMKNHCILFVFLPGNGDSPETFEKKGLFELLREKGIAADMVAVDAHLGYYLNNSIVVRLKEDVIEPARAKGTREIWLVGNSLGGDGALFYIQKYSEEIAGVILLGPFLGDREIIEEIKLSGGLQNWSTGNVRETDWQRQLWVLLKDYGRGRRHLPPMYLGYGKGDRFAFGQEFLATVLPPEQVITIEGGHDWQTWRALWKLFLEKIHFDTCAADTDRQ